MKSKLILFFLPFLIYAENVSSFSCSDIPASFSTLPTARHGIQQECKPEYGAGIFTLDFLYWQAKEEGLEYALSDDLFTGANIQTNINAEVIDADFDWEPAFKIGLGYAIQHGGWDLYLNYTHYYNHSTDSSTKPISGTENGLIPLWQFGRTPIAINPIRYTQARSAWILHFNAMDFELGRDSRISDYLSLRVHGGLKAASLTQSYDVFYNEGVSAPIQTISSEVNLKNNSKGMGPRLGFNSRWDLSAGWDLVANGAFSLVLFQFKERYNELDEANNGGTPIVNDIHFAEKIWIFKPISEIVLGINWGTCFGIRENRYFGLFLGYELQYWWEQNIMRKFVDGYNDAQTFPVRGDLFFHGLTFNSRLEF